MNPSLEKIKAYFFQLVPELNEEKWESFECAITLRTYKKGNIIIKPGTVCNNVSFINYGLIRSYYLVDNKEIITSFFCENDYFSDYESFLSRNPSVMYSDVLEDVELAEMNYDDLQMQYGSYPECERAGRLVAEGLFMHLSSRNASFLLQTPEQRYHQFLDECPDIASRVPQYMIASYLGITPEALSRIRARFKVKV